MDQFYRAFNRFCYRNRNKGIPNLMLYISLGNALVYFMSMIAGNTLLYSVLSFDRNAILHGQVWRLFTYPLVYGVGNPNVLLVFFSLFCYYNIGKTVETTWGTFRFNLFYLTGIILMDVYSLIFACRADVTHLNLSLLLSFATLFPSTQFVLFFFIPIPVKAWLLALVELVLVLVDLISKDFPYNLFPLIALSNYFLFFGKNVVNVIPLSWRMQLGMKKNKPTAKVEPIPFTRSAPKPQEAKVYTHRCTVCGRTDVTNPELEFRYCSKCNGYYCYCSDHINNHTHVQ